jgi:hypothetical protein
LGKVVNKKDKNLILNIFKKCYSKKILQHMFYFNFILFFIVDKKNRNLFFLKIMELNLNVRFLNLKLISLRHFDIFLKFLNSKNLFAIFTNDLISFKKFLEFLKIIQNNFNNLFIFCINKCLSVLNLDICLKFMNENQQYEFELLNLLNLIFFKILNFMQYPLVNIFVYLQLCLFFLILKIKGCFI